MAEGMTDERLDQIRSTYGAGKPENAGVPTAFRELLGYVDLLRAQLAEAQASERERCANVAARERKTLDADAQHHHDAGLPDERDRAYEQAGVAQRIEDSIRALSPTPNQETA